MTGHLQDLIAAVALHPMLAIGVAFGTALAEALLLIGLFVPSTILLVGIGNLVGLGELPLWPVFVAATLGAVAGDQLSYWTGTVFAGRINRTMARSRHCELWASGQRYFARHGARSIVIGRFVPGLKTVVPGVAGTMRMGVARFTVLNALSAIAWAALHLLPGIAVGLAVARLGMPVSPSAMAFSLGAISLASMVWMVAVAGRAHARAATGRQDAAEQGVPGAADGREGD